MEAGANRFAAETIRNHMLDWFEQSVPVVKDFEVSDADLKDREVIFIGRPETNSALAAWQDKLKLNYSRAVFRVGARDYGSEEDALIWAGANPLDRKHMVVVIAGNSPLETVRLADEAPGQTQYSVYRAGREVASGFEN
jgi:hypothetical protein